MTKRNQTLVRASDIGLWSYCRRAWWLARVQGAAHQHPARLSRGTAFHEAHGTAVVQVQRYRRWGHLFLAVAIILIGLVLILWLWQSG